MIRKLLVLFVLCWMPVAVAWADAGEIALDEDSITVLEEAGTVLVVIERSRGEDGAVSIDYSTSNGSATAGSDYTAVSGTLNWANNDGSNQIVQIPLIDDADAEGAETFQISLSNPTGGAIIRAGRGTSTITILASDGGTGGNPGDDNPGDDDGPGTLKFDDDNFIVLENAGVAMIGVERSQGETGTVSVDYATSAGSATAGSDYSQASGTLTWGPGDGSTQFFMVPIFDDAEAEGGETINLTLSNATGGAVISSDRGTAVLTILANDGGTGGNPGDDNPGDDDGAGTLKFDDDNFLVLEEAGSAMIGVERSQGEAGAVSVDYAVSAGSATAGSDFTVVSGTLSWGAGDGSTKFFAVPILDDGDAEGAETIDLSLSNATGGAVISAERGTAVLTIAASDGGTGGNPGDDGDGRVGIFKFGQRDFFVVESAGIALITVERSQGETGAVSVDYSTGNGTAQAPGDYTSASGTLSWGSGDESLRSFVVPIRNDTQAESAETVVLTLSNPTGGAGLDDERATAILTILDEDAGTPGVPNDDSRPGIIKLGDDGFQGIEGSLGLVTVERSQGEGGTVSVSYTVSDGSANAGLDYSAVSGTLTWGPGDGSDKSFTIPLLDDDLVEGNETVQITLSNPTGGASLDPTRSSGTLTILDTDGSTARCSADNSTLCFLGGRFQVEVEYRTQRGDAGVGRAVPQGDKSGLVWFFSADNVELLIKMLDACQDFDRFWVFFAATTNVDFTVTVTDTSTGLVKQYSNPLGQAARPVQDTLTFQTCP